MADIDPALMQKIFDIPQRKWKSDVQHYRKADDLGTGFEVLEGGMISLGQKLRKTPNRRKASPSDKTPEDAAGALVNP